MTGIVNDLTSTFEIVRRLCGDKWKFLISKEIMGFSEHKELRKWEQLISYVEVSSKNRLTSLNISEIFTDGNDFFNSIMKDLKSAKESIAMEYYIFRNDNLGSKIADILKEKAQEGVKVRVIVDGAGGYSKKMLKKLNKYVSPIWIK